MNKTKKRCVVCGGLITFKQLASTPINCLPRHISVCKKHLEAIVKHLNTKNIQYRESHNAV